MKKIKYLGVVAFVSILAVSISSCQPAPKQNKSNQQKTNTITENEKAELKNNIQSVIGRLDNGIKKLDNQIAKLEKNGGKGVKPLENLQGKLKKWKAELQDSVNEIDNMSDAEWRKFKREVRQKLKEAENAFKDL